MSTPYIGNDMFSKYGVKPPAGATPPALPPVNWGPDGPPKEEPKQDAAAEPSPQPSVPVNDAPGTDITSTDPNASVVPVTQIIQPDSNGEFSSPADGAIWMLVTYGIPQTPLKGAYWTNVPERERGKVPFLSGWQRPENTLKTVEEIRAAAAKYPGCNFGSVFNKDFFAYEADTPPEGVKKLFERFHDYTGESFSSGLRIQSSSPERGHGYYLWAEGVENIGQSGVSTKHGDFSLRVEGQQCVSPGSIHPRTRKQYRVVGSGPLAPPNPKEIAFWNSERVETKPGLEPSEPGERRLLRHGQMHGAYTSEAGRLWNRGHRAEDVVEMTVNWTVDNSADPVDVDKVRKEALDITKRYKRGAAPESAKLVMTGMNAPGANAPSQEEPVAPIEITPELLEKEFPPFDGKEADELPMLIHSFMPEGVTFFGSLPGTGKTWAGLSVAKALTEGRPLWGVFNVPEKVAVLYLIPEASDASFKRRLKKLQITQDKSLFRYRTISQGMTKPLTDPLVVAMVQQLSDGRKVLVIVDTAVRFLEADDENKSMENSLVHDSEVLRSHGASVLFQHHSPKASKEAAELTLENVLRGTGDFGAMADAVYGLRRDEQLFAYGEGPEEMEVVCVKSRDMDNAPLPFRLALSRKPMEHEGDRPVSIIDETHTLRYIANHNLKEANGNKLVALLKENPEVSFNTLAKEMKMDRAAIKRIAESRGYRQVKQRVVNDKGEAVLSRATGMPKERWVWKTGLIMSSSIRSVNSPEPDEAKMGGRTVSFDPVAA